MNTLGFDGDGSLTAEATRLIRAVQVAACYSYGCGNMMPLAYIMYGYIHQ